jgi:hypothetical protein
MNIAQTQQIYFRAMALALDQSGVAMAPTPWRTRTSWREC